MFGHYGWVVNAPASVVMQGFDVAEAVQARSDGQRHAAAIETWEAELARA